MDKELALRTFGYLIGYYKTHDETIINSQEIEAIEFILKNNEYLEQQVKKQKEVIDNAKSLNYEISHTIYEDFLEENIIGSKFLYERIKKQLSILEDKEV